jgi:predicted enzyme related to lactoylglutathione lyase
MSGAPSAGGDMRVPVTAGAVVYARDIGRVSRFYAALAELPIVEDEPGHVVLQSPAFELVVVAVPPAVAARITIASPPARREDTAIKLCFPVPSLAAARTTAARLGGALLGPEHEWAFHGAIVCDGHDPEGNVIQVRAAARQPDP